MKSWRAAVLLLSIAATSNASAMHSQGEEHASADPRCAVHREFVFGDPETGAWDLEALPNGEPPFQECHASTLVEVAKTSQSDLLVAWFAGTEEGADDVEIFSSRRNLAHGGSWSPPRRIASGQDHPLGPQPTWNPVLLRGSPDLATGHGSAAPDSEMEASFGEVTLFFKMGPSPREWWGMMRHSRDAGETWLPARELPAGFLGPIRSRPLFLADNSLLMGSSTEHDGWRAHFERRLVGGSWRHIEVPGQQPGVEEAEQIEAIQPTLLRHSERSLQALFRTRHGFIAESWSEDAGDTWSALRLLELPNPSSAVEALTLRDGTHLLIYNHTSPAADEPWVKTRSRLNVARSEDGRAWYALFELENDLEGSDTDLASVAPGRANGPASPRQPSDLYGEYSYPAAIQASDGQVHITYTWRRRNVRHVWFDANASCWSEWQTPERLVRAGEWPSMGTTEPSRSALDLRRSAQSRSPVGDPSDPVARTRPPREPVVGTPRFDG